MSPIRHLGILPILPVLLLVLGCGDERPQDSQRSDLPLVTSAMQACVARQEIAGAVTLVADRRGPIHLNAVGLADIAQAKPMQSDSLFWIASMTKPVTACAILMLQDEGRLSVDDPVAKYLPELGHLATSDGTPGNPTLTHLLTHTSGMAEASEAQQLQARCLADLIGAFAAKPLGFVPGSKWQYCQSGINTLGRIVEVVSGRPFQDFLQERIFTPLGMRDTTFFPDASARARIATSYVLRDGALVATAIPPVYAPDRPLPHYPAANGGLYSTARDYARFLALLLNQGSLDGRTYLKPATVALMSANHTGELKPGFTPGLHFGLGVGVVGEPQGVTAMLSPGSFGHGGAYGTQGWIDPVRGRVYVLMIQRAKLANGDASSIRLAFQTAAASALDQAAP